MKNFTKIIICLMLCVMSVCLVACNGKSDNNKNFDYPSTDALVTGNGGLSVQKGNYLYFVNGFQNVSDMTEKNASYTLGSLMLMKLDENGNVVKNEEDLLHDDYYITMSDKLCGFEATSLFLGGEYLYFTSPCQEDEGGKGAGTNPVWAKERVEFYRMKLDDSTSKPEEIYQSRVSYSNLEFEYYYTNGNTFILIYEKGTSLEDNAVSNALIRVDANADESSTIKTDVSSVVMAENANEIFFVNEVEKQSETLNQLNQYNIASNSTDEFTAMEEEIKVKAVAGEKVFIEYERSGATCLYSASISPKGSFGDVVVASVQNYTNYYVSEDGEYFVGIKDNKIKIVKFNSTAVPKITDGDAESITYIGMVNGNVVYVDNNNIIKSFSYYNYANGIETEIKEIAKVENLNTTYFDLAESYVYFYKTVGSNEYLHRVSLNSTYVEGEANEEMIGVYLEGDVPEVEEEEIEE